MARTGIQGQSYSTAPCEGGPTFLVRALIVDTAWLAFPNAHAPLKLVTCQVLRRTACAVQVYYSPAFLRQSNNNLSVALRLLACVYRAARSLFPLSDRGSDVGVIVYIDQLNKAGPADSLCAAVGDGQLWLLIRTGDCEAVVKRYSLFNHTRFKPPTEAYQVLHISTSLLSAGQASMGDELE